MTTSFQVSWAQFQAPDHCPCAPTNPTDPIYGKNPGCGCSCSCGCQNTPAAPAAAKASANSIRYGTGEVVLSATDVQSGGFGVPWGHSRSFASGLTQPTSAGNGYNWQVARWSYLAFPSATTVVVMGNANEALWFDLVDNAYVPRFSVRQTLLRDTATNAFQLISLDGTVTQYSATSGAFQSQTDPAGNQVAVVSYASNNFNFNEVQRTTTVDGATSIESFLYTYVDSTANYPILSSVLLRRQVLGSSSTSSSSSGSAWTNVVQALYTYYNAGDAYGGQDDLQTVETQSWTSAGWASTGTTYYRYYLQLGSSSSSSSSSGAPSTVHLLQYVVLPSSYDLLTAAVGNPLTASDAEVAQYADYYFAYNGSNQVVTESMHGGSQTYQYTFEQSGNSQGYNSWAYKTTETRPDGSQNIVYSNYCAQTMLTVLQSGSDQWCDFYQYSTTGLLLMHAMPSAVSGFDDSYADLLDNVGGSYQYLNDSTGLIYTYTNLEATGYLTSASVQQGQQGTSILLRQYEYVALGASS